MHIPHHFPNDKYTPICKAGSGLFGDVYFSLSKQDFDAATKTKEKNEFDDLKSKLVAVKVCFSSAVVAAEVKALRIIQEGVDDPHRDNFPSLLDHGDQWHVTNAILPSLSLHDIMVLENARHEDLEDSSNEVLGLHYLLEMTKACRFLYEGLKPPMKHGDFHPGNILVDTNCQTNLGLPNVVTIDFGMMKPVGMLDTVWNDFRAQACVVLDTLGLYNHDADGWEPINACLNSPKASFEGLCDSVQAQLMKGLAGMTPEDLHQLIKPLRKLASEKEKHLQFRFFEKGLMVEESDDEVA